ncbi:MAG TPA: hypothetical protein VE132_00180 [Micromonosporaceae bacterium]|nr:hypothetical protein [Micromonosporaceae bacterium]
MRATDGPTGLPMVLILESRSHLDLGDLPNLLAAELGVMTVRLERAIRSLDEVAQVHVNRWGDGAAHLHLWFLGRPAGQLQLRGPFLAMWDEILEPVPEAQWRFNLAHIAAWLEEFGGTAQVAPPRIEWHAPSTFAGITAIEDPAIDATLGAGLAADNAGTDATGTDATAADNAAAESSGEPADGDTSDGSTAGQATPESPTAAATGVASGAADAGSDDRIDTTNDAAKADWTTVDYDDSEDAKTPTNVTDGAPNPDLASDDSETVSVRIPSQPKRPQEERVGR